MIWSELGFLDQKKSCINKAIRTIISYLIRIATILKIQYFFNEI